MSEFGSSVHRIAGSSGNEVGGLIKKKPSSQEAGGGGGGGDEAGEKSSKWDKKPSEFKVPAPRTSLFGLDVLAKRKREEREAAAKFGEKRVKMTRGVGITSSLQSESHFSEDGARVSFGKSSEKQRERVYRGTRVETPSHTGGVSEEALDRIQQRMRRDRPFAVGAKSRDSDRGHKYV